MNDQWSFGKTEEGLKYAEYQIKNCLNLCLRGENNEIIAFEIVQLNGSMGMLHVKEEYRRKGLAKFIILTLSKKLHGMGLPVFCYIETLNGVSIELHEKCGFEIVPDGSVMWLNYQPKGCCQCQKPKCCV